MMILSGRPSGWLSDTPLASPSIAEAMAASRSAFWRVSSEDIAISRPSAETVIAAIAPAVVSAKRATSQLKFWASTLTPVAGWVMCSPPSDKSRGARRSLILLVFLWRCAGESLRELVELGAFGRRVPVDALLGRPDRGEARVHRCGPQARRQARARHAAAEPGSRAVLGGPLGGDRGRVLLGHPADRGLVAVEGAAHLGRVAVHRPSEPSERPGRRCRRRRPDRCGRRGFGGLGGCLRHRRA